MAEVVLGESTSLACTATGTLPLTFVWTLDGVEQQRRVLNSTEDTLLLSNVNETLAGEYSCTVSNTFTPSAMVERTNTDQRSINIIVIEIPALLSFDPPTTSIVIPRAVNLQWQAADSQRVSNGNTPILGFSFFCQNLAKNQRIPSSPATMYVVNSATLTANLTRLHPGRTYSCFVTVWNKVGSATTDASMFTAAEERKFRKTADNEVE